MSEAARGMGDAVVALGGWIAAFKFRALLYFRRFQKPIKMATSKVFLFFFKSPIGVFHTISHDLTLFLKLRTNGLTNFALSPERQKKPRGGNPGRGKIRSTDIIDTQNLQHRREKKIRGRLEEVAKPRAFGQNPRAIDRFVPKRFHGLV